MAKLLHSMVLGEVSGCEAGANDDANIEIVKQRPISQEAIMAMDEDKIAKLLETANDTIAKQSAVIEAFNKAAEDEGDLDDGEAGEDGDGEFDGADEDVVAELLEDAAATIDELETTVGKQRAALKGYDELKKSSAALVAKIEKSGGAAIENDDLVSVIKAAGGTIDPVAERRITALEAVAKKAEEDESIAKAREIGFGKAEELAPILGRIRKGRSTPEDAAKIEALLKQAGTAVKKSGAFQRIGDSGVNADEPIAKARVAAAEIRKANPNLSEQQAMTRYWTENPDEYAAMRHSQAA